MLSTIDLSTVYVVLGMTMWISVAMVSGEEMAMKPTCYNVDRSLHYFLLKELQQTIWTWTASQALFLHSALEQIFKMLYKKCQQKHAKTAYTAKCYYDENLTV
jgi:hypothetical protein